MNPMDNGGPPRPGVPGPAGGPMPGFRPPFSGAPAGGPPPGGSFPRGPPSGPAGVMPGGPMPSFPSRPGFPRPSGPSSNPLPNQPGPGGCFPRPGGVRPAGSPGSVPPGAPGPFGGPPGVRRPASPQSNPPLGGMGFPQGGRLPQPGAPGQAGAPGMASTSVTPPARMPQFQPQAQGPPIPGMGAPQGRIPAPGMMQPPPQGQMPAGGGMMAPSGFMPHANAGPPGMMQPGMVPPGPPGAPAAMPGPGMGALPGQAAPKFAPPPGVPVYQQTLDRFETLTLGPSGPGAQDAMTDASTLPRPAGPNEHNALDPPVELQSNNCHPAFMRPTVYTLPRSGTLQQRFHLPVGAVVRPLAEGATAPKVPLIKLDSSGIVRCRRCRTYINPHVTWTDGGRRWSCNVCQCLNDVAMEYFCTLDESGQRRDILERPELSLGSVEYVAPPEYMVRGPMPTVYFFVIDVTMAAVRSGMVQRVAETIKGLLDHLPGDDRKKVGFLTYDSTLHFYNLKSTLSQPQMLVVPEVEDPFVPLPDDLLVNLKESREVIDALLDNLGDMFAQNTMVESCMGSALQAAYMVTNHIGGKLLLFLSSVPTLGPGKIKNRENAGLYGTDRESSLRNPDDAFYKRFSAECSRTQITVDVFAFGSQYMDLASIVCIPRYTGGQVYYYPGFYAPRDTTKLKSEITRNLTRTTGWEAVMRIRCSKGLRISSFNGNFFIRSSDLLALPTVDPDKAFAIQITHDEQVLDGNQAFIQCALLYTASCGERRIRVHTLRLPITTETSELYKTADASAMATLMMKLGVERSLSARLDDCRRMIETKLVSGMREYRVMHSTHFRGVNKLIYPDSLRFLPLWVLGVMKCGALRGAADVQPDERVAIGYEVISSSLEHIMKLLYPLVYPLGHLKGGWPSAAKGKVGLPPSLPSSHAYMDTAGIHLVDAGRVLVLWVGRNVPKEVLVQIFGQEATTKDISQLPFEPPKDNPASKLLSVLLSEIRQERGVFPQCYVIQQGSQVEAHIAPYFVEDRLTASYSYFDFMLHLHRNIGAKQ
ncbi:hypothetical protein BSKO_04463 [Bryopsis sp. KO-2023]|nr:hypothetical protein BSKO_04463 [Bryopsis sp. KO-2023]